MKPEPFLADGHAVLSCSHRVEHARAVGEVNRGGAAHGAHDHGAHGAHDRRRRIRAADREPEPFRCRVRPREALSAGATARAARRAIIESYRGPDGGDLGWCTAARPAMPVIRRMNETRGPVGKGASSAISGHA